MYKFKIGFKTYCSTKSCFICKHCTDIFYDATNGPYLAICDMGKDADSDECNDFVVDMDSCELCDVDTNDLIGYGD